MYSRREGNMENKLSIIREAFIAAFPHTVPILAGFFIFGNGIWNLYECLRI